MKTYVVIGGGYWGKGDTLAQAKGVFRRLGGRLANGYAILTFDGAEFLGVDGLGRVHWNGPEPDVQEIAPRKQGRR